MAKSVEVDLQGPFQHNPFHDSVILSDIIYHLLKPWMEEKPGDSHFLSQKHLSCRKDKSLWTVKADYSICIKLTAHSPGFSLDLPPELTLLIHTAGGINSQRQEAGSHCTTATARGRPFPQRNSWMARFSREMRQQVGRWDRRAN